MPRAPTPRTAPAGSSSCTIPPSRRSGRARGASSASPRRPSNPTSGSIRCWRMSRGRGSSTRSPPAARRSMRHPAPRPRPSRRGSARSPPKGDGAQIELRASWSPIGPDRRRTWRHGQNWSACSRDCPPGSEGITDAGFTQGRAWLSTSSSTMSSGLRGGRGAARRRLRSGRRRRRARLGLPLLAARVPRSRCSGAAPASSSSIRPRSATSPRCRRRSATWSGCCTRRARTCRRCASSTSCPPRSSTPSSPRASSAASGSASARSSRRPSASPSPRRTRPRTGRRVRSRSRGSSTRRSMSSTSSTCATCSPPSWSSRARPSIAAEEFQAVLDRARPSPPRDEPWRRLSGLHTVRGRRALAVARALWIAREEYARARGRRARPPRARPGARRRGARRPEVQAGARRA